MTEMRIDKNEDKTIQGYNDTRSLVYTKKAATVNTQPTQIFINGGYRASRKPDLPVHRAFETAQMKDQQDLCSLYWIICVLFQSR